jgi:nitrate reductase NapD
MWGLCGHLSHPVSDHGPWKSADASAQQYSSQRGRPVKNERIHDGYHIASLVVQFRTDALERVKGIITAMDGSEIYAIEGGRMVVVLDAPHEQRLTDQMNQIRLSEGVISASLVFHQHESTCGTGEAIVEESKNDVFKA